MSRVRGVRGYDKCFGGLSLAGQGDRDTGGQGGQRELIRARARLNWDQPSRSHLPVHIHKRREQCSQSINFVIS